MWKTFLLITIFSIFKDVFMQQLEQQQQQQKDLYNPYPIDQQQSQQNNQENYSSYQTALGMPSLQQYSNLPPQQVYSSNVYSNNQPQDFYSNFFPSSTNIKQDIPTPCMCGVFLSGQFIQGGNSQPVGNPALTHEYEENFSCNSGGFKTCTNKCLDVLVKHLSKSPTIICGSIDRDCHKERAYLWIKNCSNLWVNTNLSAGREYCCKGGIPYKCPIISN